MKINKDQTRIGVDFDNSIVCYDELIYEEALRQGLIPEEISPTKKTIKDYLKRHYGNDCWTRLQGDIYGPCMPRAKPFPGAVDFFLRCRRSNTRLFIVSHKTRYPVIGPRCDLHQSALTWLTSRGFFDPEGIRLERGQVFLHQTRKEKIECIAGLGLEIFIDDLPEIFAEPGFPPEITAILFDPHGNHSTADRVKGARSWKEIENLVFGPRSVAGD